MRYGLHHGRPRDVTINRAQCWRRPRHQARNRRCHQPAEPWYLATDRHAAWYRQRGWIEQSCKDTKARFGLANTQGQCAERLTLAALPERGALPPGWRTTVAPWGRPSLVSLALALLDHRRNLPTLCLPGSP